MTTPHAITSLTLENFRNYPSLRLELPPQPVVLRGPNGAGKTNILEAISLFSPGRGLRGAKLREMDRAVVSRESLVVSEGYEESLMTDDSRLTTPWVVAVDILTNTETTFIGTGRDAESSAEKRLIKINGEKIRGHAELASHVCVQWLTPSMDQVFIEGGSARRKLLDRIVYGFTSEHATRVAAYESAMRERNRLLTDLHRADVYWLSVLEQQMAEHAVAITLARQEVLARLSAELTEDIAGFPRAVLSLDGVIENWVGQGLSALEVEQKFAESLKNERPIDAARGRASIGIHRSEFLVTHNKKNREAAHCSTGEQKALLLSLMLASARARTRWCNTPPILLLDEVIAHLDVDKRACLFDLIRHCQIQAWMTGTDAADFKGLEGFSTTLEIEDGMVKKR